MEDFTSLELFNKIYKYLRKSIFYEYRIVKPIFGRERQFDIFYNSFSIVSFYLVNGYLYFRDDSHNYQINTIEDIDYALENCIYRFCDRKFSLFLKCNLI